eukprot:TRINITY_DN1860_c0_g2_i1.p1 TRINITY_DN1860_c0_g2~~TRINITY_DN1860_c0_g2_i1.p1  ORF type:complete len:600 (+),score=113.93 TRINITY_DN1860_c0_g2_i1:29-1828(+)
MAACELWITLPSAEVVNLSVCPTATWSVVKEDIAKEYKLLKKYFDIEFEGELVRNGATLSESGISSGSEIDVVMSKWAVATSDLGREPTTDDLLNESRNGNLSKVKLYTSIGIKDLNHEALMSSIEGGFLDVVAEIVSHFDDAELQDHDRILKHACTHGQLEITKYLLQTGMKPTISSLSRAAANGHLSIVKLFIKSDDSLLHALDRGQTALTISSKAGHGDIVKFLIEKGAVVQEVIGNADIVKLLLEGLERASTKSTTILDTGLYYACSKGDTEVAKLIIEAGAPVCRISASIPNAAFKGYTELVRLLVASGGDARTKDSYNRSSLSVAKCAEITRILISNGADVDDGNPLRNAVEKNNIEQVNLLVAAKANLNAFDHSYTPLWTSCYYGHTAIANLLIQLGADVNLTQELSKDDEFFKVGTVVGINQPIAVAASNGFSDIVQLLIDAKANLEPPTGWNSALWYACWNNHTTVVRKLLLAGADVNVGRPLMAACFKGWNEVVEILLAENNQQLEINSTEGFDSAIHNYNKGPFRNLTLVIDPPILLAAKNGFTDVVELLARNNTDAVKAALSAAHEQKVTTTVTTILRDALDKVAVS